LSGLKSLRCRSSGSSPQRLDDEAADVLRGYVRHWLMNVWKEFDRIKLTDLVGSSKARA
jgi:hypothetical protein